MADISKIKLPNGDEYNLKDRRLSGIYSVIGTNTAASGVWTGYLDVDELYDGLTIAYYVPYGGKSGQKVFLNLTLRDGTETGNVKCYITGNSDFETAIAAGSTIVFTYYAAGHISISGTPTTIASWRHADHFIDNTNTIGEYAGSCIAGPFGMAKYSLILKVDETHWESLVTPSAAGTTKTKNTNGFLLDSPILYYNGSTIAANSVGGQSSCWHSCSIDTRYSTNGGQFSAAGKPFYLVGSISNGKFYLASTWWSDSLPVNGSTDAYIYVGNMYSKYQCTMGPVHPIYNYIEGSGWVQTHNGYSYDSSTETLTINL